MCGIAGIISKNEVDMSGTILDMLKLIQHRGPDASGIAFFPKEEHTVLRVSMDHEDRVEDVDKIVSGFAKMIKKTSVERKKSIPFVEYELEMEKEKVRALHGAINNVSGLDVHSIGDNILVYKEGGTIENLLEKFQIGKKESRLGIGHVRMATESAEDINAAHPFVSPFYPELALVHNGQFTNYFKLRRFLEAKGAKFKTLNDSEAASHLVAYAMSENGGDLEMALAYAKEMMDGIYCIIAATANQIGFVKDQLGIKPLLLAETEDYILLGSEQIEFTTMGEHITADEMDPGEVRVWNI